MSQFDDAFISYGRADSKAFCVKLYHCLLKAGFKIWFDQNDIPLGVDFQEQINNGIEKADNFLFVIAPHSVNSPYCLKEIKLALKRNKRIIPLLHVEQINYDTWKQRYPQETEAEWQAYKAAGKHSSFPNMHPGIGKINWVYFREGIDDFETALVGLIDLLHRHKDYVNKHTEILTKALEWERNQKQTRYLLIAQERQEAEAWLQVRFQDEQAPCLPTDLHCEFICESIKNANNLMTQVFIGYADADQPIMEKVSRTLRREGITVWTNKTDIKTGTAFETEIYRGIEGADNFVYLLSFAALNSDYCQNELDHAFKQNKRIITLLVEPTDLAQVPAKVRSLQFIDCTAYRKPNPPSPPSLTGKWRVCRDVPVELIEGLEERLTPSDYEQKYQRATDKLLKEIKQDATYYEQHKVLLVKALKWERQNRNPSILLRGYNLQQFQVWLRIAKAKLQHPPTPLQVEFIEESAKLPAQFSEVFISYSRTDSDFARKLNEALQFQGKNTWFDQENIASGADFQQEIHHGIENADNFLFILSPASINSPFCADEVEYAASLQKRFITVLYRNIEVGKLHQELAKIQWIDFNQHDGDFYVNFSELIRTLDTDRDHVQNHTKWSQRALEWQEKRKSQDLLLRGSELLVAQEWLQETKEKQKKPVITLLQQEFIQRSIQQQRYNHWLKTSLVAAGAGFITALSLISNLELRHVESSIVMANLTKVEALKKSNPIEALVLAIQNLDKSKHWYGQIVPKVESSLRDAVNAAPDLKIIEYQDRVTSVAMSADGKIIVSGSDNGMVQLWDTEGNPIGKSLQGQKYKFTALAMSADGQIIVSGSNDQMVRLWDTEGNLIREFVRKHGDWVRAVAISADGKTIVSGSNDGMVRLWDIEGNLIATPKGHKHSVTSVAISADGKTIVSGSHDDTVGLWDKEGNLIRQFEHKSSVTAVAISADGKMIVSGGEDETVRLWDTQGNLIRQFEHKPGVTSVAISADGKRIVSGSWDETVRLWDQQGNLITTLTEKELVTTVAISADGKTIVSSGDKNIWLWDWSVQSNQEPCPQGDVGKWKMCLKKACDKLDKHPILNDWTILWTDSAAGDASDTCKNYWQDKK